MSEHLQPFNPDDREYAPKPDFLSEFAADLILERSPVFQDAAEVQKFLDAQSYLNEDRLFESTHSVLRLLNKAAKDNHLIGQPAAIITSESSKQSADTQDVAVYEGNFLGFIVHAAEISNPYKDSDSGEVMFQPRLHFQIEEDASRANPKFRSGDLACSSLIFTQHQQQPAKLEPSRWSTPLEKVAAEHFGLFNQELLKPLSASSIQKSAAIGFYLLNKSAYAGAVEFEDKLIDSASFHLPLGQSCDIDVDFYLKLQAVDGQMDYSFVHQPNQTIKFNQVAFQAINSLPRSYLRSAKYLGQEIILNQQQKSLYFSLLDKDQTYHIPFEAVRGITLNGELND